MGAFPLLPCQPMPSPVFMLLSKTNWSSVEPSDEVHFLEGLKSWALDPAETVRGKDLLQALLHSYAQRETPFLNDMVHALLDRGVDPGPTLADAALSSSQSTRIKWGYFPTLLRVLQSRSQGLKSTADLDLGLALLDVLSQPIYTAGQAIAEMDVVLGAAADPEVAALSYALAPEKKKKRWERTIEGIKVPVWLALRSVDGQWLNMGWKQALRSCSESGVHKMRVLTGVLRSALREGVLTDEEVWVIHATMASMATQQTDSMTERKQAVALRKSFVGQVQDQLPSSAKKTHAAVAELVKDWPTDARQRLVRALMQAANERMKTANDTSISAWVGVVRFALELAISPSTNLLPNELASQTFQYWMGDLDRRAEQWAKTEDGVQLGIALWAASWNHNSNQGSLAEGIRKDWILALGKKIQAQSKPLGAQWPTVQKLVAGAMAHPEAHEEWKPLQAFINQHALETSLVVAPEPTASKPRL